ncbi:hypothetical protein ACIBAI_15955 [Streptomyces sp. NPDC051041]|uniref:hypothetical protein n=1 Tax=Streptomyces sp. NPDC051041 TaxID=3365640 RepID=UPI0037940838
MRRAARILSVAVLSGAAVGVPGPVLAAGPAPAGRPAGSVDRAVAAGAAPAVPVPAVPGGPSGAGIPAAAGDPAGTRSGTGESADPGGLTAAEESADSEESAGAEESVGADASAAAEEPGADASAAERPAGQEDPAATGGRPDVSGEPAAEVVPGTVSPGGDVTVSVVCDPVGGRAPATVEAASRAFEGGAVELRKAPGNDEEVSGPVYRGTARIAPAGDFEDDPAPSASASGSAWTVDGTCPAAHGSEGTPWSATFTVLLDGSGGHPCPEPGGPGDEPCGDAARGGVRAGAGGTFTDSVPALVAGGVLIAGALGAAAHRLYRRRGHGGG